MSELNCRSCQRLMRVGELYIDGLCRTCQNIKRHNIEHQRLDKVLAKFDKKSNISLQENTIKSGYTLDTNWFTIIYDMNSFILQIDFDWQGYAELTISLDTVEHLIKDMEAQDE